MTQEQIANQFRFDDPLPTPCAKCGWYAELNEDGLCDECVKSKCQFCEADDVNTVHDYEYGNICPECADWAAEEREAERKAKEVYKPFKQPIL